MILTVESILLCVLFTVSIVAKMKDPISALYDYPPKIQERVKSLDQYKDRIPTQKKRLSVKIIAAVCMLLILSLILRY